MSDEIAQDVQAEVPEAPPLRSDNPEDVEDSGDTMSLHVQEFITQGEVSCRVTTTFGWENGQPGYFMYVPYRSFFLDEETAQAIGAYFSSKK